MTSSSYIRGRMHVQPGRILKRTITAVHDHGADACCGRVPGPFHACTCSRTEGNFTDCAASRPQSSIVSVIRISFMSLPAGIWLCHIDGAYVLALQLDCAADSCLEAGHTPTQVCTQPGRACAPQGWALASGPQQQSQQGCMGERAAESRACPGSAMLSLSFNQHPGTYCCLSQ